MRIEINKQYLRENKIYDKIKSLFSIKYDLDVFEIQPLGQGAGSVVLKIITSDGTYAIKICMFPERREKVIGEFSIRKKLIKLGLDFVPKSLWVDTNIFEYGAVVFEYIDGFTPNFTKKENIIKLVHILSKLHIHSLVKIPEGYQVLQDHFKYLKDLVSNAIVKYDYIINNDFKHGIRLALSELERRLTSKKTIFTHGLSGLCHDDVASNCIIDPMGKIWLVDWENSCVEDIVEEIVKIDYGLNLDKELRAFFFKIYQETFPPAKGINLSEVSKVYLEMYPIFNICWGLSFLEANLRRRLHPKFFFSELEKQIKELRFKFSSEVYDYFKRGIKNIDINALISQN